jgi:protein-S-isoprenylcysteine O-methyltransferase Ste14
MLPGSADSIMSAGPAGPQTSDDETARAIARPPLLFLAALLLGFAMDHVLSLPFPIARPGLAHWVSAILAAYLMIMGVGVFALGVRSFSRAANPVQGTLPTTALVTTGLNAWSRNPIYLGMFFVYAAIGLAVRSPWILILLLPLALTIRYGVVAREETYLKRRFGDTYRDYMARVPRWL